MLDPWFFLATFVSLGQAFLAPNDFLKKIMKSNRLRQTCGQLEKKVGEIVACWWRTPEVECFQNEFFHGQDLTSFVGVVSYVAKFRHIKCVQLFNFPKR